MKQIVELGSCECRWPIHCDADEGHWFCAEETAYGESYCPEHRRLSLQEAANPFRARSRAVDAECARNPVRKQSKNSKVGGNDPDRELDLVELFGGAN